MIPILVKVVHQKFLNNKQIIIILKLSIINNQKLYNLNKELKIYNFSIKSKSNNKSIKIFKEIKFLLVLFNNYNIIIIKKYTLSKKHFNNSQTTTNNFT
jgi:hypothetical protein